MFNLVAMQSPRSEAFVGPITRRHPEGLSLHCTIIIGKHENWRPCVSNQSYQRRY